MVILFEVEPKVREHYESIAGGGNMFDCTCTLYLESLYYYTMWFIVVNNNLW